VTVPETYRSAVWLGQETGHNLCARRRVANVECPRNGAARRKSDSVRPTRTTVRSALVGLLTSELSRSGLLDARKQCSRRQWPFRSAGSDASSRGRVSPRRGCESRRDSPTCLRHRDHSVTAAGPSRICTGVPCLPAASEASGRPPTHDRRNLAIQAAAVNDSKSGRTAWHRRSTVRQPSATPDL
jgi:hypothetical protein